MWIYEPGGRAREYAARALNIYRGCDHGCSYCYAPQTLKMQAEEFHGSVTPRGNLKDIGLEAARLKSQGFSDCVLLCFSTDAYCPGAREYEGWTRSVVKMLKERGVRVCILSKAGTDALADIDLLGPSDEFAATLTLHHAEEWEPRAAKTANRIEALRRAKEAGIYTWASFEPVLDPWASLKLIETASPYLSQAKVGVTNYVPGITDSVDWADFGFRAEALCQSLGLDYFLKHDLRRAMGRP